MANYCYYCGLSSTEFITYGRFGCEHCPDSLSSIPEILYALRKSNLWSANESFVKTVRNLPSGIFRPGWKPEETYFSARYRIARNLKKSFFLNRNQDLTESREFLHSYFPGLRRIPSLDGKERYSCWENLEKKGIYINFLLGDEDQIRWEICWTGVYFEGISTDLPKFFRSKELFSLLKDRFLFSYHKEWGFLNSCPTNSGRGDRFSVIFQKGKNAYPALEIESDWLSESNGIQVSIQNLGKIEENLIFSVKNFNRKRKSYFLESLIPLVFKENGVFDESSLVSSNI